jgi:hypothetical protein
MDPKASTTRTPNRIGADPATRTPAEATVADGNMLGSEVGGSSF